MEFQKELRELISQRTGTATEKISPTMEFEQDLNLSHEELVEFVTEIENRFKVTFSDPEIVSIKTVSELEELMLDHLDSLKS